MTFLQYLLLGALFSGLGALTPGLINLAVAERTIHRGVKAGVMVTLGAGVIELIYTFVPLYFIDILIKDSSIGLALKVIAIVIFLGLSIYHFRKKAQAPAKATTPGGSRDFAVGIGVASMNLLIVPTWIFLGIWLRGNGFQFEHLSQMLALSLGSALGAVMVFLLYVKLGSYIVGKVERVTAYTNKFLGFVFLGLAALQTIRLLYFE